MIRHNIRLRFDQIERLKKVSAGANIRASIYLYLAKDIPGDKYDSYRAAFKNHIPKEGPSKMYSFCISRGILDRLRAEFDNVSKAIRTAIDIYFEWRDSSP